ncbi:epidermal growth factor receptor substrate 15 [Microdochium nivale]|nr:epidermal growth factor receptor substrate 15 [Microdochium nivale]
MSADGPADLAPNLNLTPEEKRVYGQLFRLADNDKVGVVTGETAVKFFEKTKLESRILGEIWQIADQENRGFLTPVGFGIVLRLIGHAQGGREPTTELAFQPGQIPRFDGINIGGIPPPPPPPPQAPAQPLQAQSTGGPVRIPSLTPEKVAQYAGLFERQPLQNGSILAGDQAKNIFEKSGLPNEALGRIWQLADTEQRGALVLTEFVIAMHLLTSMKSGALRNLPTLLPAALYEAATRRPTAARQSPAPTGTVSAIPRQLSGSAQVRTNSPLGRPPMSPQGTGLTQQTTGSDWLVTPVDKARFDQFYADLDKTNKGFITGEEAVPFLSQSGLSEDALAQVWDLADINSEGRLTRDTFAVAMYLIRQNRSRRDTPLPTSIPPNLVPPSLRGQARPPVGASPFDAPGTLPVAPVASVQAKPPQPTSALADLFDLDTMSAPAPFQQPLSTGGSAAQDPFAGGPSSPVRATASPAINTFKPFIPSSSFGRTLTTNDTGGSASRAVASDDLLGDNDPEISKKLTDETTELANLSNQVSSLSKQMQQVQGQRGTTQNEFNQASQQKKNFEDRLAQLRTLYEKEAADVATLQDQLKTVREETRKLTGEMVTIDGNYQDLQKQHHELQTALQADREENAGLKQRLSSVNAEIAKLKPQIEKLKSEARQQKGLVAINKKQLSTTESERDKHKAEFEDLAKGNGELARQASPVSPVPAPAQLASPALSTSSANNPFFKRTGSTDIMGAFASPPARSYNDKSFDDIFGSVGTGNNSATPPPPTSFKQQNTGNSTASAASASFNTPTGSTPTVSRQATLTGEPPAPPESKQLNSSFLPFGGAPDSLSSSRQVSPPASRAGEVPTAFPVAPEVDATPSTSSLRTGSPHPEELARVESIPGAFPETPAQDAPSFAGNRDSDPFGQMKDTRNTKDDFDSAFASFGGLSTAQEPPAKDTHSEFPPIAELEQDDDSDSSGEGNGFDDDFSPAGPAAKLATGSQKAESIATTSPALKKAEPATETAGSPFAASDLSAFPDPPKSPAFPNANEDPFAVTPTKTTPAPAPAAKGAFDDSDDDFEGLEDAKEGSTEDDFASMSRSNLDEFNTVFDSSPPPSQPKSDLHSSSANAFGTDSSYDFGSVSQPSTAATNGAVSDTSNAAPAVNATGTTAANNHDWDAIFADLDPRADVISTAAPAAEEPRPSSQGLASPDRPNVIGRALTEGGTHDDPIVKDLTAMGYPRKDAIVALEKYDYNLERAANFLASQS